jgi:tRNA(Ile)-lysidine synthase TilS/MesJ
VHGRTIAAKIAVPHVVTEYKNDVRALLCLNGLRYQREDWQHHAQTCQYLMMIVNEIRVRFSFAKLWKKGKKGF